jgi:urease accessory protein
MDRNCDLMIGEIITCGRKNLGEVFKYNHFQNKTEVFFNENLLLKDNILLQPQITPLNSVGGCLEEFTHQGTLIYINTKNISVTDSIDEIFEMLSSETDLEVGVSALQKDGFVIRVLGFGGEQIFDCFQKVQEKMWRLNSEIKML